MKKLFLTLMMIVSISLSLCATPAFAKCEGGVEFTGVVNNHTYCRSKGPMSWWAAFAWCEFQGRKLMTLDEACVGFEGATGEAQCPNMKVGHIITSVEGFWTANRNAEHFAYAVSPITSNTMTSYCNGYSSYNYAVCY